MYRARFNIDKLISLAENEARKPLFIGVTAMITNHILCNPTQLQNLLIEEPVSKTASPGKKVDYPAPVVFNIHPFREDVLETEKGDFDYIRSSKVHYLEFQDYEKDVDLINVETVESFELSDLEDETDCFRYFFE